MGQKPTRASAPPPTAVARVRRPQEKRRVAEGLSAIPQHGTYRSGSLPAPIAGLLQSLPPDGQGWTQQERDKFMATFGTVLDFCIRIEKAEKKTAAE
jgi:hypothetical protein